MKRNKLVGMIFFVIIGIIVILFKPFEATGLIPIGNSMLGLVLIALGLWIFRPGNVPYAAGGMLIFAGGSIAGLKLGILTSGFVTSGLWILIPALYFGYALQKTGLGKRIAYLVLKSFKPRFATMVLAWFIIGIILSLLTPSVTVRVAIVMPIALGCVEACKLEDRSRGAALICLTAFAMAILPGTGWLTGALWGPIFMGFLPKELSELATWNSWFQIMALPWMLATIIFTIVVYFLLKPKEDISLSQDTFKAAYKNLGKITREEIITLIILVATFLLFSTESIHHISTAATAMSAFFGLMIFGIISFQEISTGISWDVIIFNGIAFSLPPIFGNAQVAKWMSTLLEPTLFAIAGNSLLFIIGFIIILWIIRFVDVAWGLTTLALIVPLFIPLYRDFGIHPIVVFCAYVAAGDCFFLTYQQPWVLVGAAASQGRGWAPKHFSIAGLAYAVAIMIAILISFPYWKFIGAVR